MEHSKNGGCCLCGAERAGTSERVFPIRLIHVHPPEPVLMPHQREEQMEWIAVAKGRFRVQIGASSRELGAGEAAFVPSGQLHAALPEEEDSELYAVVFGKELLGSGTAAGAVEAQELRLRLLPDSEAELPVFYEEGQEATRQVRECLDRIIQSCQSRPAGYEKLVRGNLLSSLGLASQQAGRRRPRQPERPEGAVQPLLVYLSEHYREPISIAQAARICCVTPNYLCNLFKRATGSTMVEYINMLRIHEASRLLRLRRMTVQEVALQVGYSSLTYFGRVFRRIKHMTPTEYVRSLRAGACNE
ncbi:MULTISPECIES: AraC family transcriptional regulator [Paenibacillus]|nr:MULTISPECIES: AraC family transcriptional regulator [Paenibacillus]